MKLETHSRSKTFFGSQAAFSEAMANLRTLTPKQQLKDRSLDRSPQENKWLPRRRKSSSGIGPSKNAKIWPRWSNLQAVHTPTRCQEKIVETQTFRAAALIPQAASKHSVRHGKKKHKNCVFLDEKIYQQSGKKPFDSLSWQHGQIKEPHCLSRKVCVNCFSCNWRHLKLRPNQTHDRTSNKTL